MRQFGAAQHRQVFIGDGQHAHSLVQDRGQILFCQGEGERLTRIAHLTAHPLNAPYIALGGILFLLSHSTFGPMNRAF